MGALIKTATKIALVLVVPLSGCANEYAELYGPAEDGDPFFTMAEWAKIEMLGPLPDAPPLDPSNSYGDNDAAAKLGHWLYFDREYATVRIDEADPEAPKRNCADCHLPDEGFQKTTIKSDDKANTPTIINAAFYEWYAWDGRRDSMWSMTFVPAEGPPLGSSRVAIAQRIADAYRTDYDGIFAEEFAPLPDLRDEARFPPTAKPCAMTAPNENASPDELEAFAACQSAAVLWGAMTTDDQKVINRIYANFGKALEAYERKLIINNSPFDEYLRGDYDALTERQKRGLRLFVGKGNCVACHEGPTLSDQEFHDLGLLEAPKEGDGRCAAIDEVMDYEFSSQSDFSDGNSGKLDGLESVGCSDHNLHKFRTKQLRGVAQTGQFMHAGQLATLTEVVEFYNEGGTRYRQSNDELLRPLNLDFHEVEYIVSFLESLTGDDTVLGPLLVPPQ